MSTKTIKQEQDGPLVVNENGQTTFTHPFYVRKLKTYTPLPNGFNLELAEDIISVIEENKMLWDQGAWRRVFVFDENNEVMDEAVSDDFISAAQAEALTKEGIRHDEITNQDFLKSLRKALAYQQDATDPVCGTAMCFAGWVTEMLGADWVIDSKTALQLRRLGSYPHRRELDLHADKLFVPVAHPMTKLGGQAWGEIDFTIELMALIKARGYTPETHAIVSVPLYATYQLGLVHDGDWLEMFDANNTFEQVKLIVAAYAEYGPAPTPEAVFMAYPTNAPYDAISNLEEPAREQLKDLVRASNIDLDAYFCNWSEDDE